MARSFISGSNPQLSGMQRVPEGGFSCLSGPSLPQLLKLFVYLWSTGLCLHCSRNIMFSQLCDILGLFWQDVGWAGVEITCECSLNKELVKVQTSGPGFCWLQGGDVIANPLTLIAFTSVLWLMEGDSPWLMETRGFAVSLPLYIRVLVPPHFPWAPALKTFNEAYCTSLQGLCEWKKKISELHAFKTPRCPDSRLNSLGGKPWRKITRIFWTYLLT